MKTSNDVSVPETNSYNTKLDQDLRSQVANLVEKGKKHLNNTIEEIIEFGKVLLELKVLLPHGSFTRCVESEYGISEATACNYMNAAKRYSDKPKIILDLAPTVLYLLASPLTSYEVVDKVFLKIEAGEKVTADDVRKLKKNTKTTHANKETEVEDFFDNLDIAERKEIEQLETKLKGKLESLIKNAEKAEE